MDWVTFFITYGILFLGELGDKTQLIVFNLALEYKKFYKVGIGVTIGFVILVTIGVFFGTVITRFLPLFLISIVSASKLISAETTIAITGLWTLRPSISLTPVNDLIFIILFLNSRAKKKLPRWERLQMFIKL